MKKIAAMLLAGLLLAGALTVGGAAAGWENAPEFVMSAERSGDTITVSVAPKTAAALTALEFDLTYDADRLTAVGDADAKTGIYGLTFGTGGTVAVNYPSKGVLAYAAARSDNYSVAAGAAVAAMQFTIGKGHTAEEFTFTLTKLKAGTYQSGAAAEKNYTVYPSASAAAPRLLADRTAVTAENLQGQTIRIAVYDGGGKQLSVQQRTITKAVETITVSGEQVKAFWLDGGFVPLIACAHSAAPECSETEPDIIG